MIFIIEISKNPLKRIHLINNLTLFFCQKKTDVHLELILNFDWFQPYSSTLYSIGIIYVAIANLLRDI